jgi:ADP-ribose pyrophosphatase
MTDVQKEYTTQKGVPIKLHENKLLSVYFNGYYHYIEFNKTPSGAIVIPRFGNGDFLLVQQRRAPVFGESLEFPRGGVDIGEAPVDGARRELVEETGYRVDALAATFLGVLGPDTATLNGFNHVFLVEIPDGAVQGEFDSTEITKLLRVTPFELRNLVRDNKIFDGQSLAAYGMLLAHEG